MPSIAPYIDRASLAISHAGMQKLKIEIKTEKLKINLYLGSGSITEILDKKKPLVVAENTKLLNNQQAELAHRSFI